MTQNRAVFLDRDGTLNFDPGYLGDHNKVEILSGVKDGLIFLKRVLNFKLIVVSNQSGIARGLINEEQVVSVNNRISELLSDNEPLLDEIYYCKHHPDFSNNNWCECRKPKPGMILKAYDKYNIDLSNSFIIGDSAADILSGLAVSVFPILLNSLKLEKELEILSKINKSKFKIANDFSEAVQIISHQCGVN
ncbi:MAG: HAD family hydrolase [Ignavibacteriaceae bacterium]|nr:HAD family hydrolase [Ignavibacteriaceae bacterium]